MKYPLLLITIVLLASSSLHSRTLARIGDEKITTEDLRIARNAIERAESDAHDQMSDEDLLNQIINFRLGVKEVRSLGVDKTAEARRAMDAALLNHHLLNTIDKQIMEKNYSRREISDYYRQNPAIRFQRIAVRIDPSRPEAVERTIAKLSSIRTELSRDRKTFQAAARELGDELIGELTGSFDKTPLPSLMSHEISDVRALEVGQISPIMSGDGMVSMIKLLHKYPLSSEYVEPINRTLRLQEISRQRRSFFERLRRKYASEIKIED